MNSGSAIKMLSVVSIILLILAAGDKSSSAADAPLCDDGYKVDQVQGPAACTNKKRPDCIKARKVNCPYTCKGVGSNAPPPYGDAFSIPKCSIKEKESVPEEPANGKTGEDN